MRYGLYACIDRCIIGPVLFDSHAPLSLRSKMAVTSLFYEQMHRDWPDRSLSLFPPARQLARYADNFISRTAKL